MSICTGTNNEYTFTFTGERELDGLDPESLNASVTKYGVEGVYSVNTYDPQVDNEFTFTATVDGIYNFILEGTVSGVVMDENFIVDFNSRELISAFVKEDVKKLMCGTCDSGDTYKLLKALLYSAEALLGCAIEGKSGEMVTANNALDAVERVSKSDCYKKICQGGC